jgi:hypothetical protein
LGLRENTREIIKLVEKVSGIPVDVHQNEKLDGFATVTMSRKCGLPHHLIQYKTLNNEAPDYLICFQCGYILRLFQAPKENRLDIYGTTQGKEEITNLLHKSGGIASKFRLNKNQTMEVATQMQNGLIRHLRSIPVGLRISQWLRDEYPLLQEYERTHVEREIKVNYQNFQSEVKNITPAEIYQPTQLLSAAYALYWAEKFDEPKWANPYKLNGYAEGGIKLLNYLSGSSAEPEYDIDLINTWGRILNIMNWYAFSPYEPFQGKL